MQNVGQTTAKETISALQQIFAIEGLLDTMSPIMAPNLLLKNFKDFVFNIKSSI